MSKKDSLTLKVSIEGATTYDGDIVAYVFTRDDRFVKRVKVKAGAVSLPFSPRAARQHKLLFAPPLDKKLPVSPGRLRSLGGFEAVFYPGSLVDVIRIPGSILDNWPFCFCWVTGRVLKDGLPVCNARVHLCEVDRHLWLRALPDPDILRLRDDLMDILEKPRIPVPPWPVPEPDPLPLPGKLSRGIANRDGEPGGGAGARLRTVLNLDSPALVRQVILANLDQIYPYICLLPFWWHYHCDDLGSYVTDANGRFSALVFYNCQGDKPDIYAWVEYQFGSIWETIHRPPMACNTHWNYHCGTDIIINISDARVPVCDPEPDPSGSMVAVMSIGNTVSISEIQTSGADKGLTRSGQPFGRTLEPRVDFSRTDLIAKGITHYRWSYRRLSGPDGSSSDVGPWMHMDRSVYRHYRVVNNGVLSYPSDLMGPDPDGPAPNTFRIKPAVPPNGGQEWVALNQHVDLASGYFDTGSLPGAPVSRSDGEDSAAGCYELKLEIFEQGRLQPVEWETMGVNLKIPNTDAPFGTGTVPTVDAPEFNRIRNAAGNTVAFRMVLRVDNNFCVSEVFPATGPASSASCGVLDLAPTMSVGLGFRAYHPQGFATYRFNVTRGDGDPVLVADTTGQAGETDPGGYVQTTAFRYHKSVTAASLLAGGCSQAAFAQVLNVHAMATNGYSLLQQYDAREDGAFALATPCVNQGSVGSIEA
jgi:hypothetical protein